MLDEVSQVRSSEGDFVEFARAGAPAKGDFYCSSCGYGVSVNASLPQCPMCAGTVWEPVTLAALRQHFQA